MNEISQWLAERWATGLADIISSMAGERPAIEVGTDATPSDGMQWWQHGIKEVPDAAIWSGALQPDWFGAGKWVLASAGIETIEEADARNTWTEIVNQTAAAMAAEIASRVGTTVQSEDGSESPPPPEAQVFAVSITAKEERWTALVAFSEPLITALSPAQQNAGAGQGQGNSAEPANMALEASPRGEAGTPGNGVPKTLDLLLDVELPVSVSFGRAQLPLKDVLKLTTGAIVELNRTIKDPVEVIVNNCVIARGEVVVVEGNYGVRIREILSREHRMRSLR